MKKHTKRKRTHTMTSLIQFRMPSEEKQKLESILKSMGLDCPTAFRMFAAQVIAQKKIPFEIVAFEKNESKEGILSLEEVKEELGL